MVIGRAISRNRIPVRLTAERWAHILEGHAELEEHQQQVLDAVQEADCVLEGHDGAFVAVRRFRGAKLLVVVYREFADDGFIVTAFFTSRAESLTRRKQLWP